MPLHLPVLAGISALLLLDAAWAPAGAQAPQTRYTELVRGRCKFVSADRETGEEQVKRCPGHGGAEVETLASHTQVYLSFRFSPRQRADRVVAGWSLGDQLEWRGPKTNKGFEPYAAIVRVLLKDPASQARRADGQVLAVMRVDPREAEACPLAFIDAGANKDPNALARETADRLGPAFLCDSDKPVVAGEKTRWTAQLMASAGR